MPTSDLGLQDKVFTPNPKRYEGGDQSLDAWARLKEACAKRGIAIHTHDLWRKANAAPDDILVVQNHPNEPLVWRLFYSIKSWLKKKKSFALERRRFFNENYAYFPRRILIQTETPIITPYAYRKLDRLIPRIYQKIFLVTREPEGYDFFNHFLCTSGEVIGSYFNDPKEKFLVLINTNKISHSFSNRELFGERLHAIQYFSGVPGFDLFGSGWNKLPKNPLYWHYKKYAARAWRGTAENKMKTIAQYKFMICYENSSYRGYVSEKIFDCMAAGVVPVYLGAPDVETIVPKNCFIDKRDFKTYEELHAFLKSRTEKDLETYRKAMAVFLKNRPIDGVDRFIDKILLG